MDNNPILSYHNLLSSFLTDCLPPHLKELQGLDKPEIILARVAEKQKELDALNNIPLEELIKKKIVDYHKWMEEVESKLTVDQKLLREDCNNTIAELRKWEPKFASSEHSKVRLMECLKNKTEYALYEWMNLPDDYNAEFAKRQIDREKKELANWIEELKNKYPIAVEYFKERDLLESQLMQDLEQLI